MAVTDRIVVGDAFIDVTNIIAVVGSHDGTHTNRSRHAEHEVTVVELSRSINFAVCKCEVGLGYAEVIRSTNEGGTHLKGSTKSGGLGGSGRSRQKNFISFMVGKLHIERAVGIAQAQSCLTARRGIASVFTKTIRRGAGKATKVRRRIVDGVIGTAQRVGTIQTITEEGLRITSKVDTERIDCVQGVIQRSLLTAELDGTKTTIQAHPCLTTEQAIALTHHPIVNVKAVFQGEDCRQTTAQILSTLEAQTAARLLAALQLPSCVISSDTLLITDARINYTINRHIGLRGSSTSESAEYGECKKRFFHFRIPKLLNQGPALMAPARVIGQPAPEFLPSSV